MFAVYSSDYDPRRLDTMDGAPEGTEHIERVVRFGDRPMDLLVDTGQRRVIWTFRGRHSTTATRTGYFVADYKGEELFHGLERNLRSLHESDGWSLPFDGELRWDAGFHLWRVDPDLPGLADEEQIDLLEALEGDESIAFGVTGYYEALAVVRAVAETDVEATVGVAGVSDPDEGAPGRDDIPIDLLVCPGASANFVPLNEASEEVLSSGDWEPDARADVGGAGPASAGISSVGLSEAQQGAGWSPIGQASLGMVIGLLALSVLSFATSKPVHPITGLSTIGAFLGSAVGFPALVHSLLTDNNESSFLSATRSAYGNHPDWVATVVGYGTLTGFLFPFVYRELGRQFDATGSLFGYVARFDAALPSVGLLLVGMLALGWLVVLQVLESRRGDLNQDLLLSFTIGHFLYAILILLATGLANAIWFGFIPSVS